MTMAAADSKVDDREVPADAHERPAVAASRADAAREDRVGLRQRRPGAEPREDLADRGQGRCRLGRSAERHQAAPLAQQGVPLFVGHAEVVPTLGGVGEGRSATPQAVRWRMTGRRSSHGPSCLNPTTFAATVGGVAAGMDSRRRTE